MNARKSLLFYMTFALVLLSVFVQETEARRKILRGRKALTRTYYRENAVPAWVVSMLVGIGMVLIGGVLYFVMRKMVLSDEEGSVNINDDMRRTYHQAPLQDEV